jgi:phospholipid transport system substrate-binding protein
MRSLLCITVVVFMLSQPVWADDVWEAEGLLRSKLDAVVSILQRENLTQESKSREITEIVMPIFNFPLMAKLTLGKKYWPGLSDTEKERFTDLFTNFLRISAIEKLPVYSNESLVYKESVKVKKKVHILTELLSNDDSISILYKFFKSKNGWQIYDVEVEGVSIISTYRSQFFEILQEGTINDLLLKLEIRESSRNDS